ncbi:MAG: large subunit ribosomal protein [Actinomycetota bacterium]|jgi:large subunit ribosomal protein L22
MPGPKTNERPGTHAVLRDVWISANKVRVVLDLIRGVEVGRAREILEFCERDAAFVIGKLLDSAIANAEHNDSQVTDELYVSACFADEGRTNKRWRPRARGRATRIRKRTSHITLIVSRLPDDRLARLRARRAAEDSTRRARRVAGGRKASQATQAGAREGSRLRRRRGQQAAEGISEDVVPVEELEEEGIVDQQDAALDAVEELAEDIIEDEAAEEAGAVDQQEAATSPESSDEGAASNAEAPAEDAAPEEPDAEPSNEEEK